LGVADRVHFLGRVDMQALVEAYNICDVYVMTSRHSQTGDFEGYGIAAVEAALCGKPSVVTSGCGLEEAILPGETGLLVPENDPQATAKTITLLLKDESLRRRLGDYGRQRALQDQTWGQCAAKYTRVLRTISEKERSSSVKDELS
jgi:phosphatidylinositol alpha-1,6-mannosyltransferase